MEDSNTNIIMAGDLNKNVVFSHPDLPKSTHLLQLPHIKCPVAFSCRLDGAITEFSFSWMATLALNNAVFSVQKSTLGWII